jgi:D-alanine-D-alanine ligase
MQKPAADEGERNALSRKPRFPDITAIFGDPGLADVTKVDSCYSAEDLESVERLKEALTELRDYRFTYLNDHQTLLPNLLSDPPDFVLNLCDTGFRNVQAQELNLPAFLDMLRIPYTGATPMAMAWCYDKALVRSVAATLGVPVPAEVLLPATDPDPELPGQFPMILKPNRGDGSVGIPQGAVVHDRDAARAQLLWLRSELPGQDVLAQEFLPGAEYSVGLIGNPREGFAGLPVLQVDYSGLNQDLPRILSYESKTVPDSPFWTQIKFHEARIPTETKETLAGYARLLFERFALRDYGRFDFRAGGDGVIKLLEVNPNPAWCWDGKMNFMAGFAGYRYSHLLQLILESAQQRVAAELAKT